MKIVKFKIQQKKFRMHFLTPFEVPPRKIEIKKKCYFVALESEIAKFVKKYLKLQRQPNQV